MTEERWFLYSNEVGTTFRLRRSQGNLFLPAERMEPEFPARLLLVAYWLFAPGHTHVRAAQEAWMFHRRITRPPEPES